MIHLWGDYKNCFASYLRMLSSVSNKIILINLCFNPGKFLMALKLVYLLSF